MATEVVTAPLLFGGPPGWLLYGVINVGAAALTAGAIYMAVDKSGVLKKDDPKKCTSNCSNSDNHTQSDTKPPFKGEPGSTVQGPDNSRTYGDDGHPLTDRDAGHPDEAGVGSGDHSHDWGRPEGGGPPTNADRGPARPPQPGDPPAPWRGK